MRSLQTCDNICQCAQPRKQLQDVLCNTNTTILGTPTKREEWQISVLNSGWRTARVRQWDCTLGPSTTGPGWC